MQAAMKMLLAAVVACMMVLARCEGDGSERGTGRTFVGCFHAAGSQLSIYKVIGSS
jgi:hypothetical protein